MGVQYSGNVAHVQFDGTTKALLIAQMQTTLTSLGWTVVSGGGSTNLLMQTVVSPQNLQVRYRFKDNGGQCMTISIENVGGTRVCPNNTTDGVHVYPNNHSQYRLIANPYQFMLFNQQPTVGRRFAAGGVPWIPPFLQGFVYEAGWLTGSSYIDNSDSLPCSWRTNLGQAAGYGSNGAGGCANYQAILNNQYNYRSNHDGSYDTSNGPVDIVVQAPGMLNTSQSTGFRWGNDAINTSDVFIGWGAQSRADELKLVGQVWDTVLIHEGFDQVDMPARFDEHDWICITYKGYGRSSYTPRGSVFVTISD